jgi:hypothetical protein
MMISHGEATGKMNADKLDLPKAVGVWNRADSPRLINAKNIDTTVLEKMIAETLTRVTSQKNTKDAWLSLVEPDDVIGLMDSRYSLCDKGPQPDPRIEKLKGNI